MGIIMEGLLMLARQIVPAKQTVLIGAIVLGLALPTFSASRLPSDITARGKAAVRALEDLASVLSVGVNYVGYGRRVGDAKIVVSRFLRVAPPLSPVTKAIEDAEYFYEHALFAWRMKVEYPDQPPTLDVDDSQRQKFLKDPSEAAAWLCDITPPTAAEINALQHIDIDGLIQVCWSSAQKRTADARRLLWR